MTQAAAWSHENFANEGTPEEKEYLRVWLGTETGNLMAISRYVQSLRAGAEKSWWEGWQQEFYPPLERASSWGQSGPSGLGKRQREVRYADLGKKRSRPADKRSDSRPLERSVSEPMITSNAGGARSRLKYVVKFLFVWGISGYFYLPLYAALRPLVSIVASELISGLGLGLGLWGIASTPLVDEQLERATNALEGLMTSGARRLQSEDPSDSPASGVVSAAVAVVVERSDKIQITQDSRCICENECKGDPPVCKVSGREPPARLEGIPRPTKPLDPRLCQVEKGDEAPCFLDWRSPAKFPLLQVHLECIDQEDTMEETKDEPANVEIKEGDAEMKDSNPIGGGGGAPGEDLSSGFEASYYTRTLAYVLTLLVFGAGVGAVVALAQPYAVVQTFVFIVGALYAISATVRLARELLYTIFNLLLNTGLGLGFFDVHDDSLGAFLERLKAAVTPRQIYPILFSNLLDPLREALSGVGAELSFWSVYENILLMVDTGNFSSETVRNLINQGQKECTVQLTKDGTCPCRDECLGEKVTTEKRIGGRSVYSGREICTVDRECPTAEMGGERYWAPCDSRKLTTNEASEIMLAVSQRPPGFVSGSNPPSINPGYWDERALGE